MQYGEKRFALFAYIARAHKHAYVAGTRKASQGGGNVLLVGQECGGQGRIVQNCFVHNVGSANAFKGLFAGGVNVGDEQNIRLRKRIGKTVQKIARSAVQVWLK